MDESDLARLRNSSLVIVESSTPKKFGAVYYFFVKAYVKEQACACSSRSSLSWITVNDHNVLWVSFQPLVHVIHQFEQYNERRSMMVLPVEVTYAILKSFVVVCFLAYVK